MQTIVDFFSETLVMDWLFGSEILKLFDTYFLALSSTNQVLLIVGVLIFGLIGSATLVKWVLKMTFTWIKVVIFIGLIYYLFVVILGFDILEAIGL